MDEKIRTAISYLKRFPELLSTLEMVELYEKFQQILEQKKFWIAFKRQGNSTHPFSVVHYFESKSFEQILGEALKNNRVYQRVYPFGDSDVIWYKETDTPEARETYWLEYSIPDDLFDKATKGLVVGVFK